MSLFSSQVTPTSNEKLRSSFLITKREKQILKLISLEYSEIEIARKVCLSPHTVHSHRKNLMRRWQVKKSVGLVRKGFEMGILPC